MIAPQLMESLSVNSDDLGGRVLALLRYYGQGKRSAFVQQIARKAVSTGANDDTNTWDKWWQIYHRLCDFGLVTQIGQASDMSWQWVGDRLSILQTADALFPTSSLSIQAFQALSSRLSFAEEVVYQLNLEGPEDFEIRYLVSKQANQALSVIEEESLPITTSTNSSIFSYLPSAQDAFGRSANSIASLPDASEMEQRDCMSSRWVEHSNSDIDYSYLLRKAREDRPGYRYWLVEYPEKQTYEMLNSYWLPLLLWWVGGRQWQLIYEVSKKQLLLPAGLYFSSPALLRNAFILRSMRWPNTVSDAANRNFVFVDFPISDVRHLTRLYAPALKVTYVK